MRLNRFFLFFIIILIFTDCKPPKGNTSDAYNSGQINFDIYLPWDNSEENMPDSDNIKTITNIEYDFTDGEPDFTNGFVKFIEEFDQSGNCIKFTTYQQEENMKEYEEIIEYFYNESDKKDSMLWYTIDYELVSKTIFEYQDNQTILYDYSNTGSLKTKTIWILNENEDILSLKEYSPDGELIREIINVYDDMGLKSSTNYSDGSLYSEKVRIKYEDNILIYEVRKMDDRFSKLITEKYDEENMISDYYSVNNDDFFFHSKTYYFENGLEKKSIYYNERGEPESLALSIYEHW